MGSLFYINVPTREHELILRQRALQIKVEKEIPNVNKDLLATQLNLKPAIRLRGRKTSIVGKIPTTTDDNNEPISEPAATQTSLDSELGVSSQGSTGSDSSKLSNKTTQMKRTSIISKDSVVDVYEAVISGKKTNIVVSQDSMIIYPHSVPLYDEKDKDYKTQMSPTQLEIDAAENMFLERHLEIALKDLQIYDATWGQSIDGNFSQVTFTVQDFKSEGIINFMLNLGIGTKYDSTLSVCSAVVYYNPNKRELEVSGEGRKGSFGAQFMASIKSRLTVAQVVQTVQSNAVISFDYILLLTIAAIIAALGLLENSSVNLVASMLISPLMGPIMAGCFGTVVRDKKLIKTGVISELIGLFLCLLIGFMFGVCVTAAPFEGPWAKLKAWPTDEMLGRGKARSIAVGAFVAIPSGAGVALSILAGNAGSLVGVAISASLLPPAVNCGMFLGMSAAITIKLQLSGVNPYAVDCGDYISNTNETSDHHFRLVREGYTEEDFYCKNVVKEYGILGIVSFGLTIVNIVLILMSGFLILKLKEVAPHTTRKTMSRFWKEDLKVMREYNKTHGSFNKQAILAEIGGTNNAAEIRARLTSDAVFNQVTRRNVFGNQIGAQDLLDDKNFCSTDEIQTTPSLELTKPINGGGWFNGWFSSGKTVEKPITAKPSKISNRPHVVKHA